MGSFKNQPIGVPYQYQDVWEIITKKMYDGGKIVGYTIIRSYTKAEVKLLYENHK